MVSGQMQQIVRFASAAVILLALTAWPSTGWSRELGCVDVTETQIADLFVRWNDALRTLDPDKVVDNYARDATLLPTADIASAVLFSLPSYDVNLFLNGALQMVSGQPLAGLVNAIGNPIAANVGLLTLTGGLELTVLAEAADSILNGTPYPSP